MPPFLPRKRLRSSSPPPESSSKLEGKGPSNGAHSTNRRATVFDAIDGVTRPKRSREQSKKLLEKLAASDSDSSSLSSISSPEPEFEDVPRPKRQKTSVDEEEEDDDDSVVFEDVQTHEAGSSTTRQLQSSGDDDDPGGGDLNLTLTKETRISITNPHDKKRAPTKIERGIRIATHQMHVQFLMWHNAVRNSWICDQEVHKILLGQLGPTVEKEITVWKRASGLVTIENTQASSTNGKGKSTRSEEKEHKSRDWGTHAQRQSTGKVDMSHGDPLFRLVKCLTLFWKSRFRITEPGLKKMGYMPLYRMDEEIKSYQKDQHDPEVHGERVANLEAFRERAKLCEGSRDLGAQLFTALLRAIGLDTRMVASLQPVGFGWSAIEDAADRKEKKTSTSAKQAMDMESDIERSDQDMPDSEGETNTTPSMPAKGSTATRRGANTSKSMISKATKTRRSSIRASGAKDAPIHLSEDEAEDDDSVVDVTPARARREPSKAYEKDLSPNYWSEVLSPVTGVWTPCSTLLPDGGAVTNETLLTFFEPKGKKAEKAKQVMAYLIGYSSDGTAKDVTVRYLRRHMFPGKTKGMRMPAEKIPIYNRHGKVKRYEQYDWFRTVMSGYIRRDKDRTQTDDHEDATDLKIVKPEKKEVKEGEETLASYKASDVFVLEKHMRREEALVPGAKPVKSFSAKNGKKGVEEHQVFLRRDVVKCKTMETWHKEGRAPKPGEEPLKKAPYRVATMNRKRELAEAEAATGEVPLQGLYSYEQTDWIIPPPIKDGVIPKNNFGNMDVYVPSMVPLGAVHLPYRGTVKVCKQLGIDYAEAVTGFEFGGRMAIPVITGVVVADKHEELVIERWHQLEAERIRKEDIKKQAQMLSLWRKFLMGLRITKRVREEYGDQVDDDVDELNPWTNRNKEDKIEAESMRRIIDKQDEEVAGGFFPEGHEEEEPVQNQGFFPTAHESDEDDGGGGFVVQHGDDMVNASKSVAEQYATPTSPGSKEEQLEESEKELIAQPQPAKTPGKALHTRRSTKNRARRKTKTTADAKEGSGRGRRGLKAEVEAEDIEASEGGSPLSDLLSNSEPEAKQHGRRRKQHVAQPVTSSPARRTLPKRQAARKSETALKSHYFENSEDDDQQDDLV